MVFYKNGWLWALALLWTNVLFAQQIINTTELLGQASLLGENEMLNFLDQTDQTQPWIEKLEFRTETNEWDFSRQEYLFRLSKNSGKERKAQEKVLQQDAKIYRLEDQVFQQKQLLDRYDFLTDWYYAQQELNLLKSQKLILEDRSIVLQKMAENDLNFEFTELLRNEENLHDLQRNILLLEHQIAFAAQRLGIAPEIQEGIRLDTSDWPSVEQMETRIQQASSTFDNHPEYFLQRAKVDQALAIQELEEAKGKKVLDFAQLKYSGRESQTVPEEFSIGIGVNIPLPSTARIKKNKANLEYLEERHEIKLLEIDLAEDRQEALSEFKVLLQTYKMTKAYIAKHQIEKIQERYLQSGAVQVESLLQLKERLLNDQKLLFQTESELCSRYLQILEYAGQLFESPTVNYLSNDLKEFKIQ